MLLAIYLVAILLAPFPYWPTYIYLWRHTISPKNCIPWSTRGKQILFLSGYLLVTPFYTLLWYLDEMLFPSYRDLPIHPIFIIGQPRSGTTLLHRTLAADNKTFFAVRHIEWRYPFISIHKILNATGFNQRLIKRNYWPDTEIGRRAARMHPNTMADWEEDGIFFEERFLHHFFLFLRFPCPELLPLVDKFTQLPDAVRYHMLNTHRQVVRKVAYLRNQPQAFYLSKEVTSHSKFPDLLHLYPDARFILVVRKSSEYMGSLSELMRASTASKTGIDPVIIPRWTESFIKRMQEDSMRLVYLCREVISENRQVPICYSYLLTHVKETVEAIYAELNLDISSEFLSILETMNKTQQDRERGYHYSSLSLADFTDFDQFVRQNEQLFFKRIALRLLSLSSDSSETSIV